MTLGPQPGRSDEMAQADAPADPAVPMRGWASRPLVPSADAPSNGHTAAVEPEPRPALLAPSRLQTLSTTGWLLLATVAVVLAVMTFAIPPWTSARSTPRVVLLGSGSSLSVLIQSGDARVVIAAGNDPAAFGRAFGQATALASGRIDLLIVGATGADLAVPVDLARGNDVRQVVRLGSLHPGRETGDLPPGLPQVPPLARLDVAPGLTASIETIEIPTPKLDQPGDFDLAWRAQIRYGAATVLVLSDAEYAGKFAPLDSRGVLVAATDDDLGALLPAPSGALIVNGEDVDGSEIRSGLPSLLTAELPTIRVHSGTAVPLLLTDAGVELPPDDVVLIRPLTEAVPT